MYDIGKNIILAMLEEAGFGVIDLGVDVPTEGIVAATKANDIKIEALLDVLTLAIDSMKKTMGAIKAAGMKDVKVIIGSAPVFEEAMRITGADEWAHSLQKTVLTCKAWAAQ